MESAEVVRQICIFGDMTLRLGGVLRIPDRELELRESGQQPLNPHEPHEALTTSS